ncbi:hypothetical protein [Candidatus Mycoplasma mahonii]|uniref:hypothetical protein n=1 Tax=Candidatus Mycoplasma mahonii TaxID=3004105 RepID=UPI0026F0D255|nr:hypothetical protein [Candidatus Mycoplasma mahonii]WKX02447.1 hypothetical protein O3I44_03590 [Candidatus Mycoplasma mahonii]
MNNVEDLNLSFQFEVVDFKRRILDIKVLSVKKDIMKNNINKIFEWFMEDLIFFIEKSGFQKRWDFGTILLGGINNLEFEEEKRENFTNMFKLITNWDMVVKNENN